MTSIVRVKVPFMGVFAGGMAVDGTQISGDIVSIPGFVDLLIETREEQLNGHLLITTSVADDKGYRMESPRDIIGLFQRNGFQRVPSVTT